jgi:hypothetical protein
MLRLTAARAKRVRWLTERVRLLLLLGLTPRRGPSVAPEHDQELEEGRNQVREAQRQPEVKYARRTRCWDPGGAQLG